MTTEEKRSRMIAMCRLNSIAPYNDCDRCKLRSSCRKSGYPPAHMSAETVEMVFNDAVERGIFRDELTVDEMREKLVRICSTINSSDCYDGVHKRELQRMQQSFTDESDRRRDQSHLCRSDPAR